VNDPDVRATVLYPWKPENFVFDDTTNKDDIDAILFPNEVKRISIVVPSSIYRWPKS
jgi:hypothetical protein